MRSRRDDRDEHALVGDLLRVAAVFADDAEDLRADRARFVDGADEVHGHVLLDVAAADGEDEQRVARASRRETFSHSAKQLSQPSSLTRAVSSETLSVGV